MCWQVSRGPGYSGNFRYSKPQFTCNGRGQKTHGILQHICLKHYRHFKMSHKNLRVNILHLYCPAQVCLGSLWSICLIWQIILLEKMSVSLKMRKVQDLKSRINENSGVFSFLLQVTLLPVGGDMGLVFMNESFESLVFCWLIKTHWFIQERNTRRKKWQSFRSHK